MTQLTIALAAALAACILLVIYTWRSRLRWLPRLLPIAGKPIVLLQARIWATLLAAGAGLSAAITLVIGNFHDSTLGYLTRLTETDSDSWGPMLYALRYVIDNPDQPVYEAAFLKEGGKFQYPLMSLLPLDPLVRVGMDDIAIHTLLTWISAAAFLMIGIVCAIIWARAQVDPDAPLRAQLPLRSLLVLVPAGVASAALFFPITRGVHLGQIQTTLTLGVAVAILAWLVDKKWVAGLVIGLCCMVKPQWAVLVLWAAIRRQWSFVLSAVAVAMVFLVTAVAVYGFGNVFSYVQVLSVLGRSGESFFPNQSVNGLANRALFNGVNLEFSDDALPPPNGVVYALTIISTIAILLFALLWKTSAPPTSVELSIVILSLTIASPIAWEHHYGVVLPILAVALGGVVRWKPFGRWSIAMLAIAYLLTSQTFFSVVNRAAHTHLNFVQSYMFFGAILLLVLLCGVSLRQRRLADRDPSVATTIENGR